MLAVKSQFENFDMFTFNSIIIIIVSILTAGHMYFQAKENKSRRSGFIGIMLAYVILILVEIIFFNSKQEYYQLYEFCRLFWGFTYTFAFFELFGISKKISIPFMGSFFLILCLVWTKNWIITSTICFTLCFSIGAFLFFQHWKKTKSFGSLFCATLYLCLSIDVLAYLPIIGQKEMGGMLMGYTHYSLKTVGLFFSFLWFSEDLDKRVRVKTNSLTSYLFITTMAAIEVVYVLCTFLFFEHFTKVWSIATASELSICLLCFLPHYYRVRKDANDAYETYQKIQKSLHEMESRIEGITGIKTYGDRI